MIKSKIKTLFILLIFPLLLMFAPNFVVAQEVEQDDCLPGWIVNPERTGCVEVSPQTDPNNCNSLGTPDAIEQCLFGVTPPPTSADVPTDDDSVLVAPGTTELTPTETDLSQNSFYIRLMQIINFLSVGVAIVITISVAIAGVQYTMSRGDPGATAKAVNRIVYALLALFLYAFGWTILNWLIPGGAF